MAICTTIGLWFAGTAYGDGQRPPVEKKHLNELVDIQSYPCAQGVAWFYDSGALESCRTARDASFGEARVPAGSWIHLTSGGQPDFAFLRHDTRIATTTLAGGRATTSQRHSSRAASRRSAGSRTTRKYKVCHAGAAVSSEMYSAAGQGRSFTKTESFGDAGSGSPRWSRTSGSQAALAWRLIRTAGSSKQRRAIPPAC
jgi:hypothetical protein